MKFSSNDFLHLHRLFLISNLFRLVFYSSFVVATVLYVGSSAETSRTFGLKDLAKKVSKISNENEENKKGFFSFLVFVAKRTGKSN